MAIKENPGPQNCILAIMNSLGIFRHIIKNISKRPVRTIYPCEQKKSTELSSFFCDLSGSRHLFPPNIRSVFMICDLIGSMLPIAA